MHQRLLIVLLSLLGASGCVTAPATAYSVPRERATECRRICTDLDMRLSAVVVIYSKAGCVCEPREEEGAPVKTSGASAAAGGAIIQAVIDEEEQAASRRSSQQHSRQPSPGRPGSHVR